MNWNSFLSYHLPLRVLLLPEGGEFYAVSLSYLFLLYSLDISIPLLLEGGVPLVGGVVGNNTNC